MANLFILLNFNQIQHKSQDFSSNLQAFLHTHLNEQHLSAKEEFINQYFEFYGLVLQMAQH